MIGFHSMLVSLGHIKTYSMHMANSNYVHKY